MKGTFFHYGSSKNLLLSPSHQVTEQANDSLLKYFLSKAMFQNVHHMANELSYKHLKPRMGRKKDNTSTILPLGSPPPKAKSSVKQPLGKVSLQWLKKEKKNRKKKQN